jgi:two-component system, sporulation sensor kinase D
MRFFRNLTLMNITESKKRWKIGLLIFAGIIGVSSLVYTQILVKKLQIQEKEKIELRLEATKQLVKATDTTDSQFIVFLFDYIINKNNTALIIADSNDVILQTRGLDSTKTLNTEIEPNKKLDPEYFQNQLEEMKSQHEPIVYEVFPGEKQYIYYKDSSILTQLKIYPYLQLTIIAIFLIASYLAFSSSRKAEQNRVWVGMAKETAHQLGTPISSLLAWMDYLKEKYANQDQSSFNEMEHDIQRLELVADRFSKIGSMPQLNSENVLRVVEHGIEYIQKRSPARILYEVKGDPSIEAKLNPSLFDWVIENLCKNAANAIGTEGKISIFISKHKKKVYIDVSDTGVGIPKSKFETVFEPGYTTRKRGWGLGLSLVKRIIENYHYGQIFVKESTLGKGTTFRIILNA